MKTPSEMSADEYARLGLMAGLEVHAQLATRKKLFCRCPVRPYSPRYDAEILRHMRPTLSELGEYDGTALMEFKTRKNIIYRLNRDTVCTYERRLGEPGRKVHAGRSRNDQVLCALRLCTRQRLLDAAASALDLASALLDRARSERETPLPGFSHTRKAMPTTVGHYLAAFAEELLDGLETLDTAYRLNDRSPLGSAAGFGSRLPLDRDYVARLLGFSGVQHNTLAVQNSRGPLAALVLFGLTQLLAGCARLALDLILFSAPEPGFFSLPEELTTGSSLMPQKRNPDVLELIRGRAARVRSRLYEVLEISAPLYSGYHRDLQLTKEPLIRGLDDAGETLAVLTLVAEKLIVHRERCLAACTPDLFATDAALDLVLAGRPFREAYREVKADIESVRTPDVRRLLAAQTISGSPGNPGFDDLAGGIAGARKRWTVRRGATEKKLKALLDR